MGAKTILLVDDDVDFLLAHQIALESAGFRVLIAHDSCEALALVGKNRIDAAVLDVIMTTRDEGFHLARRLRAIPSTKTIPLLMLSSINAVSAQQGQPLNLSDADRDETWLPVDRFLDKPIAPSRLVELIRELVG